MLWAWIVAVCVVGAVLLGFRRPADERADDDLDEPADVPVVPPVRWTPYDYPMGPVSAWPHVVDRPEAVPTGSPADRSFTD